MTDKPVKAVITVVFAIAGALVTALATVSTGDIGDISVQTWLIAAATVLGSGALVWWTENSKYAPTIKTIMAFLTTGIASLVVALDDNIVSQAEALTALTAAIAATGLVYQAPGPDIPE
jgi:FtsH-binding integral membrane protein